MEQVIKPKSIGGLVRSLSGLFITKENPQGLTPKECTVLAVLLSIVGKEEITREHKVDVSGELNQSLQVTTNYISKFKRKRVVTEEHRIHPLFFTKVVIDGADIL